MCAIVHKECVPLMFLRAYRAAELRVNMLKDNIEIDINPLKPELNPICYLLALLGVHHFLHVSRIRFKLLTLR